MSKILKIFTLAFIFSLSSAAFAEPPDDVGTGQPCADCTTTTTTTDSNDDTPPDDVGTGSTGSWWDYLLGGFE